MRSAYFTMISGGQEQRIRFKNGDVDEDVWFTPAKIELLRTEMAQAEALCADGGAVRPRRHAFTAG